MARLLLARGADVNFIEPSAVNRWNTPVLHDAIRAGVFSTRFGRNRALPSEPPRIEVLSSAEDFERAFGILSDLIRRGGDANAEDSFGNSALLRAVLDARQVVDSSVSPEPAEDRHRVFGLLLESGAIRVGSIAASDSP